MSKGRKFGNIMISFAFVYGYMMILSAISTPFMVWGIYVNRPDLSGNYFQRISALLASIGSFGTYGQLAGEVVCIAVALILYRKLVVKKNKKNGTYENAIPKLLNVSTVLTIILGAVVTYNIALFLAIGLGNLMPRMNNILNTVMSAISQGETMLTSIAGAISVVIFAPLGEELTLRGLALNNNRKAFKVVGCMIISAVLFGILHGNPIQGIYVLPLGAFSAFICYKYKSVIPGIILHMIYNLIGMYIDCILEFDKFWWLYIVITLLGIAALIPVCMHNRFLKEGVVLKDEENS